MGIMKKVTLLVGLISSASGCGITSSCCGGAACEGQRCYGGGWVPRVCDGGTCAKNPDGRACARNADCISGWCDGGYGNQCSGTCRSKKRDGGSCGFDAECYSGNCKNADVTSQCGGTCGLSAEGGSCDEDSDCQGSSMYCEGGQTGFSCGRCVKKKGSGGTCTTNDDCLRGDCRGIKCPGPSSPPKLCEHAFCYESPGFPRGTRCTEDRDCRQDYDWCEGGGVGRVGVCSACPGKCAGQGCHACNNDLDKLVCGATTDSVKAECAVEVVVDDVLSCLPGAQCAVELANAVKDYADDGGELTFGNSGECLTFDGELSMEGEEDGFAVVGSVIGRGGVALGVVPKTGKFTATLDAEISVRATISMEGKQGLDASGEMQLGQPYRLASFTAMVGKLPIYGEVEIQPRAWLSFEGDVACASYLKIDYEMPLEAKITFDVASSTIDMDVTPKTNEAQIIPAINAGCELKGTASLRVGPRFTFKINKIPATLDVAAGLHGEMELHSYEGDQRWDGSCASEWESDGEKFQGCNDDYDDDEPWCYREDGKWCYCDQASGKCVPGTPSTTLVMTGSCGSKWSTSGCSDSGQEFQGCPSTPCDGGDGDQPWCARGDGKWCYCDHASGDCHRNPDATCIHGSASLTVSMDVRPSMDIAIADPFEAAYEACKLGVDSAAAATEMASCLAKNFGISLDDERSDITNALYDQCERIKENSLQILPCAFDIDTEWSQFDIVTGSAALQQFCGDATDPSLSGSISHSHYGGCDPANLAAVDVASGTSTAVDVPSTGTFTLYFGEVLALAVLVLTLAGLLRRRSHKLAHKADPEEEPLMKKSQPRPLRADLL